MGLVHPGVPKELALEMQRHFSIRSFVETGTYYGGTAVWAAQHFDKVITIEFSEAIYKKTSAEHSHISNVEFRFGHSGVELPKVVPALTEPVLFWLDGHWSQDETYGEGDECPLMQELDAIIQSDVAHFILIDDARLFLAPPPKPHRIEQWPSIQDIILKLQKGQHSYRVFVHDDFIVAVPESAKQWVAAFLQEQVTSGWMLHLSPLRRGMKLMREGAVLLRRGVPVGIRRRLLRILGRK